MSVIYIKNKLEIKSGNVIQVPGCEPISSLTSQALAKNMVCNASIIPVEDVLRLIPGSRIVKVMTPIGQSGTGMFIELPSGPPQNGNVCPPNCVPDWYQILKDNARVPENTDNGDADNPCSAERNFTGCIVDYDPTQHPRNPGHRPSTLPLGA